MRRCVPPLLFFVVLGCTRPGEMPREASGELPARGEARRDELAGSAAPALPAAKPFALVELFTSEGCSSCPPADANLARLLARAEHNGERLFVASFHVDYWDYLGWKDPFSDSRYSARQEAYGRAFGRRGVYTPQLVVNGAEQLVGSKIAASDQAVERALASTPEAALTLESHFDGSELVVKYLLSAKTEAELAVALLQRRARVSVLSGENGGTTGAHVNVVRAFATRPVTKSAQGSLRLALPPDMPLEGAALLGWLSHPTTRAVAVAELAELPESKH